MSQRILVATSLPHRRRWYRDALKSQEIIVETAENGLECLELIRQFRPEILITETFLLWGGGDGVLSICQSEDRLKSIAVIVIDDGHDSGQTYRIGAFSIAGYWRRYPTQVELRNAIQSIGAVATSGKS